jgi:hypothetical protein
MEVLTMAESLIVQVNPDGSMKVLVKDYVEGQGTVELENLVNALNSRGLNIRKENVRLEPTGEFHKHTHEHGVHDHH